MEFYYPCLYPCSNTIFFYKHTTSTEIYTLSLHDALPISLVGRLVAQTVEHGLGDEGRGGHLRQARFDQRTARAAPRPLRPGEAASARRGRQEGGDLLVADQARDLLDQVLADGEVRPPGGRGDHEGLGPGLLEGAADPFEGAAHLFGGVGHADDPLGKIGRAHV